jgi:uncharacterized membrane protein HdeD (DUF308 family)
MKALLKLNLLFGLSLIVTGSLAIYRAYEYHTLGLSLMGIVMIASGILYLIERE